MCHSSQYFPRTVWFETHWYCTMQTQSTSMELCFLHKVIGYEAMVLHTLHSAQTTSVPLLFGSNSSSYHLGYSVLFHRAVAISFSQTTMMLLYPTFKPFTTCLIFFFYWHHSKSCKSISTHEKVIHQIRYLYVS